MARDNKKQEIYFPVLSGGLNQGVPRDHLNVTESPQLSNVVFIDGVPQKRTGYSAQGGTGLAGQMFLGGYHYQDGVTGDKEFCAVTIGTTDPSAGDAFWTSTVGGNWTADGGALAATRSSFRDAYVCFAEIVNLSDYKNHLICIINNTNPLVANPTLAFPVQYISAPGTSGSIDFANLTGGDGYNADDTTHYAKWAVNFADHLFLCNVLNETTAGSYDNLFFRIRISNLASFTAALDWDSDPANPAAEGHYQDLRSSFGAIIRADVLRNNLVIYQEKAIWACWHTSDASAPFRFDCMLPHVGLLGVRYLTEARDAHYFLGSDRQVYEYFGGRDLRPIGDPIKTELFGSLNNAASSDDNTCLIRNRGFAMHFKDIQAVGFFVPTATSELPDTCYVFYYTDRKWVKWRFANSFTGYGVWEQPAAHAAAMVPLLGTYNGSGACALYKFDYSSLNDNATAVSGSIETKDVVVNLRNNWRMMDVWFEAKGSAATLAKITVSVQVDGGDFAQAQTFDLDASWDSYHYTCNVSGYCLRLKFSDATASRNFYLGQVRGEIEMLEGA